MEDRIRDLFASLLHVAPHEVNDTTDPTSVARWDSMQHLILVCGAEEELGVEVEPEEAAEMYTDFGTFKRILLRKLNGAEAGVNTGQ